MNSNPWTDLLNEPIMTDKLMVSECMSVVNKPMSFLKSSNNVKTIITDNNTLSTIDNSKVITINEIVNIQPCDLLVGKVLEYQYVISKFLKNNMKNISEMKVDLINKLKWLLESCQFLSNKFCLDNTDVKKYNQNAIIPRSSYKFCKFNHKCKYLYKNNHITNCCYDQHIVYNYLCLDITNLSSYINNNIEYNMDEIQKCINTIYFVVNHIKEELENLKSMSNCNLDNLKFQNKNK